MKKEGYIKANLNLLKNSIKNINTNIIFMVFFDVLFLIAIWLLGAFLAKILQQRAASVILPQNLLGLGVEQAQQSFTGVRNFYFLLIFSIIFMVLFIIAAWSLFKGINWSIAAKKKFTINFCWKFLLLNLSWIGFWILLTLLLTLVIKPQTFPFYLLAIVIISSYLTNLLYPLFVRNPKSGTIKKAFELAFKKIHYVIIPYIIMLILIYVLGFVLLLLQNLPQRINIAITALVFLALFAFARLYFTEVAGYVAAK